MKILELAPYVFIENHPYGSKNKSGLAYMIRSICDMLASENDVHVLTQSILTGEQEVCGWKLLKRSYATIIGHLKWRYLKISIILWRKDKSVSLFRRILYCLSAGQVEDYINKWKPDIVHIHGIGAYTLPYYLASSHTHVPIVSTLHGLISFHSIVPASEVAKEMERRFLDMCISNGYSLTFISSGMKQKVVESYGDECQNISVIPNCFRKVAFVPKKKGADSIIKLICVGSVYPLKNQIQVIRVLPEIQDRIGNTTNVELHIYGDGSKLEEWKQFVVDNGIVGVKFYGRKPQKDVFEAVSQADLLVFPSVEEGFGIPIVEAYSCGTPVVTFSDLDASNDIANEDCCIFAKNRTDEALIEAIVEGLTRKWERNKIASFSGNFTLNTISSKYNNIMKVQHKLWSEKEVLKMINQNT